MAILEVCGASSCGKSYLLRETVRRLDPPLEIKRVPEIMRQLGGLGSIYELRNLDSRERMRLRKAAWDVVYGGGDTVTDAHFALYRDGGYEVVFPRPYLGRISTICLVTSEPQKILDRRRSDKTKVSRAQERGDGFYLDINSIREEQEIETAVAQSLSRAHNIPLRVVDNTDDFSGVGAMLEVFRETFPERRVVSDA